jgi:excisionase family DNA binding protein
MTSIAGNASGCVLNGTKSRRSPDLIAEQRSGHGVSSAAATKRQTLPSPDHSNATAALDTTGSAPLPTPPDSAGTPGCQLLTARTVAERLDVCAETVLRWIRRGELPAIRLPGGAVRITQSELQDWLRSRATPARGVLATTTDAADCKRYPAEYDQRR